MRGLIRGLQRAGLHPSLVAAMALMLVWVAGYRRLAGLGDELIPHSRSGLAAFARYLTGDHAGAARRYLAGLRGGEVPEYADDRTGADALLAGDRVLAAQRANATLALVPSAVEPRITLAEIALDGGRVEEAGRELSEALARRPDHGDGIYLAAIAAARLGRVGDAIDLLNRALAQGSAGRRATTPFRVMELAGELATRPPGERPLCLLAHLYRYLRIFDAAQGAAARAYAEEAIATGDRPADAWLTLAVLADRAQDHVAGLRDALRAAQSDPGHAEAFRLASAQAGYFDRRLEYWLARRAFQLAPSDARYVGRIESALRHLSASAAVMELLRDAAARDPENLAVRARLVAWVRWAREPDADEHEAVFEALLRRRSGDVP